MKKIIILLNLLSIFCFLKVYAKNQLLAGRVICIDAGHGGFDPGATYKDLKEADVNLEYAHLLKSELEEEGATVYLTRYDDYDLSTNNYNHKRSDILNRIKIIKDISPDIFISIHLNADSSNKWNGAQTFYNSVNENNMLLAESIQKKFKQINITKRNIKKDNSIFLLKNLDVAGVLIELGFITNNVDRMNLVSDAYQKKLVKTIVKGIRNYFLKIHF